MIWMLALVNAGLVLVLAAPGPDPVRAPWDEPPAAAGSWWQSFRRAQVRQLAAAGMEIDAGLFLALRGGAVLAGALGMWLLLGPVSSLCGGLAGWLLVQETLRSRQDARLLRFADQFREVLQSIASSLRSGRAMVQALEQARSDLLQVPGRERDLLAGEMSRLLEEMRLGASLETALRGLCGRVPLEEVRLFADAVAICRVRGGNLVEVLQTLIRLNVDRFQVRQEVRVQTAQKRLEGLIISVMPVIMLLLLVLVAPDYMAPLTGTAVGQAMVGTGLFLVLASYLITRSITRIEV